ncbi:MAG: hypothetical protein JXA54_15935 [Candidatus Heimdallarchaeota archaeon]|nr:hypothetical protein [Candidatus Heimdallarchaeota archaeon]
MTKRKKESFFWTSYSDLMTSLFFVMLVLFVLTIAMLHKGLVTTKDQLAKIKEIEESTNKIDTTYFEYRPEFKKHILKINVNFPKSESNIQFIELSTQRDLLQAGLTIQNFIEEVIQKYPVQYLLIIEGQASRDNYCCNYELSYQRALALYRFWIDNNIAFGSNCEVLISGSGTGGTMRENEERLNQRFLIHIVPKPGIIEASKQKNQ